MKQNVHTLTSSQKQWRVHRVKSPKEWSEAEAFCSRDYYLLSFSVVAVFLVWPVLGLISLGNSQFKHQTLMPEEWSVEGDKRDKGHGSRLV